MQTFCRLTPLGVSKCNLSPVSSESEKQFLTSSPQKINTTPIQIATPDSFSEKDSTLKNSPKRHRIMEEPEYIEEPIPELSTQETLDVLSNTLQDKFSIDHESCHLKGPNWLVKLGPDRMDFGLTHKLIGPDVKWNFDEAHESSNFLFVNSEELKVTVDDFQEDVYNFQVIEYLRHRGEQQVLPPSYPSNILSMKQRTRTLLKLGKHLKSCDCLSRIQVFIQSVVMFDRFIIKRRFDKEYPTDAYATTFYAYICYIFFVKIYNSTFGK